MLDCVVNGNAAASTREGARGKHASAQRNVYLGKYSITKRAILCVVVLTQGIREYSSSSVQAIGRKAAAVGDHYKF